MAAIGKIGKIEVNDINKMLVGSASPIRSPDSANSPDSALPPTKISSAGKLQHALSQLHDAARRLSQPHTWQAAKASTSAPDVVDATTQQAEVDQKIDVRVDQIATAQTTAAPLYSPLATPIGLGTLNIELGNWNTSMSSFTANPNWPKASVSTAPGDVSVERLRDKINAAGIGVIANVISDPTGSYLILRAASPGKDNGFRISVEVSPEATAEAARSLKALEFDPASSPSGMTLTQPAQDAVVNVNGQTINSSSNFLEDVVPGVDITAKQVSKDPVSIAIKSDRDVARSSVEAFVNAYNDVQAQIGGQQDAGRANPSTSKSASALWSSNDQNHIQARKSLESLGVSMHGNQQLMLDQRVLERSLNSQRSMPEGLDHLTNIIATALPGTSDSQAPKYNEVTKPASTSTSPLFRQAVLEQYTNNMYAEDAH